MKLLMKDTNLKNHMKLCQLAAIKINLKTTSHSLVTKSHISLCQVESVSKSTIRVQKVSMEVKRINLIHCTPINLNIMSDSNINNNISSSHLTSCQLFWVETSQIILISPNKLLICKIFNILLNRQFKNKSAQLLLDKSKVLQHNKTSQNNQTILTRKCNKFKMNSD